MTISFLFIFIINGNAQTTEPLTKLCHAATETAFLGTLSYECGNSYDKEIFLTGTKDQIGSTLQKLHCKNNQSLLPWILLFSPRIEVKKAAYSLQEDLAKTFFEIKKGYPLHSIKEELLHVSKNGLVYTPESIDHTKQMLNALQAFPKYDEAMENAKKIAPAFCSRHLSSGCSRAIIEMIDLMKPKVGSSNASISMLPIVEEVLTNPIYAQAAAALALEIDLKVDNLNKGQSIQSDLFTDLFQNFLKITNNHEQATNYTWNLLAFYSTRGASFDITAYELFNAENSSLGVAMYLISAGMSLLDHATVSNYNYSYPRTVRSNCEYGKPYHFWMTAYLSHKFKSHGYNGRATMLASYFLSMFYEFGSVTWGRNENPNRAFISPLYAPSNNSVRLNLAINGLGSKFGSSSDHSTQLFSIERDFSILLDSARPLSFDQKQDLDEKLKNPLTRYLYWNQIFAPEVNF